MWLPIDVVEALVQFENYLVLDSLCRVDDAAAKVLARFAGMGLSLPNFDFKSLTSISSLVQLLANSRIDFPREFAMSWLGSSFSLFELAPYETFLRNEFQCNLDALERIAAAETLTMLDAQNAEEYLSYLNVILLSDDSDGETLRAIEAVEKTVKKAHATLASLERLSHHENIAIATAAQKAIQTIRREI